MAKLKNNQFLLPSGALITEHPILFSTEMVQANLEDRKTQTRRITDSLKKYCEKYQPVEFIRDAFENLNLEFFSVTAGKGEPVENPNIKSPYGKPGDLLWVKETWNYDKLDLVSESEFHIPTGIGCAFVYKAENLEGSHPEHGKMFWKPSIHMPKGASRIWMMIEEIRVEQLINITDEDSIAEGIQRIDQHGVEVWKRYDDKNTVTMSPMISFWSLWASINGESSWQRNPWVWVIQYRILSKTGHPSLDVIEQAYSEIVNPKSEIREEVSHE